MKMIARLCCEKSADPAEVSVHFLSTGMAEPCRRHLAEPV